MKLAWTIQEVLQAASAGDYSKRCPVSITESFANNPLTTVAPSINLLLDDLQTKERAQEKAEAELRGAFAELQDKMQTIARQASDIRRLSTPVIEVWDDVLVMPLIGVIDQERGEAIMDNMLTTISKRQARCVILDITGAEMIDTAATSQLLKVVSAGKLVGAYCILTGVRPEVAQALMRVGADLSGLTTFRTVKDGLHHCLRHLGSRAEVT